jgi:hypothetical protein
VLLEDDIRYVETCRSCESVLINGIISAFVGG